MEKAFTSDAHLWNCAGPYQRVISTRSCHHCCAVQHAQHETLSSLLMPSCRTELFPYQRVIFYAVVTSMFALDRVSLKKRVVDAPEILTVIGQVPGLAPYLNSLYQCK